MDSLIYHLLLHSWQLETQFNPNLYQDEKICLSLLETCPVSDESQKWNPFASSLVQDLLSIQTQFLVQEPMNLDMNQELGRKQERKGRSGIKARNISQAQMIVADRDICALQYMSTPESWSLLAVVIFSWLSLRRVPVVFFRRYCV